MSGIAIYLEGGGPGPDTKKVLRRGMEAFLEGLRDQARAKGMYWKLVPCGGRRQAFNAWLTPRRQFQGALPITWPTGLKIGGPFRPTTRIAFI